MHEFHIFLLNGTFSFRSAGTDLVFVAEFLVN